MQKLMINSEKPSKEAIDKIQRLIKARRLIIDGVPRLFKEIDDISRFNNVQKEIKPFVKKENSVWKLRSLLK